MEDDELTPEVDETEVLDEPTEDSPSDSELDTPDPLAWMKDLDPAKVEKTWNKFTESWDEVTKTKEELARERDELAPLKKLREALDTDPGLVDALDEYYNRADSGPDAATQVKAVKAELDAMKFEIATNKELETVAAYAAENGFPEFDRMELLKHATVNRIGNLKSAYRDMNIDAIVAASKESVVADIKKNAGAATVKTNSGSGKPTTFSVKEIEAMDAATFERNYAAIQAQYQK